MRMAKSCFRPTVHADDDTARPGQAGALARIKLSLFDLTDAKRLLR